MLYIFSPGFLVVVSGEDSMGCAYLTRLEPWDFFLNAWNDRNTSHFHSHSVGEKLVPGPHLAAREAEKCVLQLKVIEQAKTPLLRKEGRTHFVDHWQSATGMTVNNKFSVA